VLNIKHSTGGADELLEQFFEGFFHLISVQISSFIVECCNVESVFNLDGLFFLLGLGADLENVVSLLLLSSVDVATESYLLVLLQRIQLVFTRNEEGIFL
jgi:hypothetical protein